MHRSEEADGSEIVYNYDANGRLVSQSYPDGSVHSYAYDSMGRKTVESGGESDPVTWEYDGAGRVVAATQPVGTGTKTITYEYDKVGNRTKMTDAEGLETTYSYDAGNRQTEVSNSDLGANPTYLVYDNAGRLTDQYTNYSGGVGSTHSHYSYDTGGRLDTVEHTKSGTPNVQILKLTYTLDNAGRRTQVVEDAGGSTVATTTFVYDGASRLTEEKRITDNAYWYKYEYDGAGNRTYKRDGNNSDVALQECTYDAGNKLTSETVDGITYSYDDNGNLTEKSGGSTVDYTWNHEDKLTAVDDATDLTMKTDALGFRRKKEVSGGTDTRFLYDLGQVQTPGLAPVVAEYNGSGVLQGKYHSGAVGLLGMRRSSTTYWYLCDALGSVRKLTDTSGTVTDSYLQDAWGNLITSSGSTVNPFRYIGRENYYTDTENSSALMLLGVRYYSSSLGRFITPDPIGLSGGDYNLYRYVKDGPVNGTDAGGLWTYKLHGHCTWRWARETWIKNYTGGYWGYMYPKSVGEASLAVDKWYNSAVFPANWHMHFNFQYARDSNKVRGGYPLDETPDTRTDFFDEMLGIARARLEDSKDLRRGTHVWSLKCEEAMEHVGMGLHAIEDIYAHGYLTPWEHLFDEESKKCVDDPQCGFSFPTGKKKPAIGVNETAPIIIGPPGWILPNLRLVWVRIFPPYPKNEERIKAAEEDVRSRLVSFLYELGKYGCVLCDKPVPKGRPCWK